MQRIYVFVVVSLIAGILFVVYKDRISSSPDHAIEQCTKIEDLNCQTECLIKIMEECIELLNGQDYQLGSDCLANVTDQLSKFSDEAMANAKEMIAQGEELVAKAEEGATEDGDE